MLRQVDGRGIDCSWRGRLGLAGVTPGWVQLDPDPRVYPHRYHRSMTLS